VTGKLTADLTLTYNAPGSPMQISLSGTGTAVKLSPTELDFRNQKVGTTSAPRTVKVTNVGTAWLSIFGITLTGTDPGDFSETNTCGSSLAGKSSCTITVKFTPTALGSRIATLDISDGDPTAQQVTLFGTGT
jgi:FlaG/FlaF family flagellin (archaellin)